MDVNRVDGYLPRDRAYQERLKAVEKKMVNEAEKERKGLKSMVKSKSAIIDESKRTLQAKSEKLDILKSRLKKRAMDAQQLVNKAMEAIETGSQLGTIGKLQDTNIKVFSRLNVPVSEIQSLKGNSQPREPEPSSSLFALTSAANDDSHYQNATKNFNQREVKRDNRFETPGQLQRVDEGSDG